MFSRTLIVTLVSTLLLAMLAVVGCSDDIATSEPVPDSELNLTDAYGGYTATSEAPGFGDPEMLAGDNSEPALDEMAASGVVDSLKNLADRDIYSLELLWGNLEFDSAFGEVTDWMGSLAVERGAIVAARLIAFDRGDHIIRPRPDCMTLEWGSVTGPHFDGILVFIVDPEPDSFATENSVTFSTAPYTRTLTMSELAAIDEVVDVGENQVSINGFLTVPLECQQGFFQGRWMWLDKHERGRFDGRWLSDDGYLMGHAKGHFGVRDDGERVLFGKWIGLGGAFRGLLRGEWGYDVTLADSDVPTGWFSGRWDNASGTRLGGFEGNWIASSPHLPNENANERAVENARHGHGFWRGQWYEICE